MTPGCAHLMAADAHLGASGAAVVSIPQMPY